jgi:LEA14-like dessication related protein
MCKSTVLTGLLFGLFLFQSCVSVDKFDIGEISNVKVQRFYGSGAEVTFDAEITNNGLLAVNITGAELNVMSDNAIIGTINQINKIKIPGHSSNKYQFNLDVKLKSGALGAFSIIRKITNGEAELKLNGAIYAKVLGVKRKIPVDESFTMN